ncbi:hypothetical protein RhiirA4_20718 [Rhizophagus irregularis]|uniref:Uncharacterized protein n=1 Tax=Rhizophagus irregularis TaxID=588596 RepID=A0A2I1G2F9_9GLOM|nr:hypothetical protein RhiirA4_20718 [Rhizophagus irregularis]
MTDSTKLREKLVYAEELNYIAGSTLLYSEKSIEVLEDIHPKINYILENNVIATQVRAIALKVPIGKIPPMMIAMIPTKGNEGGRINCILNASSN